MRFDTFLKENASLAMGAMKLAEAETKAKAEKIAEIKKLTAQISAIKVLDLDMDMDMDLVLDYEFFIFSSSTAHQMLPQLISIHFLCGSSSFPTHLTHIPLSFSSSPYSSSSSSLVRHVQSRGQAVQLRAIQKVPR